LLELYRGYRARTTGAVVRIRRPAQEYASATGTTVARKCSTAWSPGFAKMASNKPLHTLRREFGSLVCAAHGIHAASRQLRHANIAITNMFYTDSRKRALTGLGHLLKSDDKVVLLSQDLNGPSRIGDLALGGS